MKILNHHIQSKYWVEINNDRRETYNTKNIQFKTTMIKPTVRVYSDSFILVKGTTVVGRGADAAAAAVDRNNNQEKN